MPGFYRRTSRHQCSPEFAWYGQGSLVGFPVPFLIMILIVIIADLSSAVQPSFAATILCRRQSGGGPFVRYQCRSRHFIGLHCFRRFRCRAIPSMARLQSGVPTAFVGVELRIIAACVIGGMSLSGGEGSVTGALLGLVFMALISNAMTLFGVSIYWEGVITGSILILEKHRHALTLPSASELVKLLSSLYASSLFTDG